MTNMPIADALKRHLADREVALVDLAVEQLDRGEGLPFDAKQTKRRGRERRQRVGACPE